MNQRMQGRFWRSYEKSDFAKERALTVELQIYSAISIFEICLLMLNSLTGYTEVRLEEK